MLALLAGLEFAGDDRDATYTIGENGLSGWLDGVDMRRDAADRPNSHGSFDVPGYLTGRVITLSGSVFESSVERYERAIAALMGVLAYGDAGRLYVEEAAGVQWADVRRHGAPDVRHQVYGKRAKYQLQFWAADPRRYGIHNTVGPASSLEAYHYGNFPAASKITVTGTAPSGYTVNGPGGRQFVVTRALTAAAPHTIDMATGWLSIGGVVQVGGVGRAETWAVPPGPSVTMSVTAGVTLTVDTLDTYI